MSKNQFCKIWDTPASGEIENHPPPNHRSDGSYLNSPRAGGKYFIAGLRESEVKVLDNQTKARLTSWLIEQRRFGEEWPEITPEAIADAKQRRDLPIYERADRLLSYLMLIEPPVGQRFFLDEDETLNAQAWTESGTVDLGEMDGHVKFFLAHLHRKGWIDYDARQIRDSQQTRFIVEGLTVDGYARLEEVEHQDISSSQAFVAMWFDNSITNAWEEGIKPAIKAAGYEAFRIDRKEHNNKIDDEIVAEIRRSRFIVADFTQGKGGARGGVYYEAGFAHGLGIPVIFTCRKDVLKKVHFDTRQYNHIVWETPEKLRSSLANRIAAVVGDGPLRAK